MCIKMAVFSVVVIMMQAGSFSETSVYDVAWCNIVEESIFKPLTYHTYIKFYFGNAYFEYQLTTYTNIFMGFCQCLMNF